MIYLYVKKCSHCDKKYFGKTYAKDPYSYSGSGLHWRRHLKYHKASFETLQIWKFTSQSEATEFALLYSSENNIATSLDWFNLREENALDGNPKGNVPVNKGKPSKLKGMTYEEIYGDAALELRNKRSKSNKKRGARSEETKQKISRTRKDRIASKEIEIVLPPLRPQNLQKANEKIMCPHCSKVGSRANMIRWHFSKCKHFLS